MLVHSVVETYQWVPAIHYEVLSYKGSKKWHLRSGSIGELGYVVAIHWNDSKYSCPYIMFAGP